MTDNLEMEIIPLNQDPENDDNSITCFQVQNIPPSVLIMRESKEEDVDNVNQNFYSNLFASIKLLNIKSLTIDELKQVDHQNNTLFTLSKEFSWNFRHLFWLMDCQNYEDSSNLTKDFQYKDAKIRSNGGQKRNLILRLIKSFDGNKTKKIGDVMVFHIFEPLEINKNTKRSGKKHIKSNQIQQVQRQSLSFKENSPIITEMNSFNLDNKTQRREQDSKEDSLPFRKMKQNNQLITSEQDSPNSSPSQNSKIKHESPYVLDTGEPDYQPLINNDCHDSISKHSNAICLSNKIEKLKNKLNLKRENPIKERLHQREDNDERPPSKQSKVKENQQNNQYLFKSRWTRRDNNNEKNNFIIIDYEEEDIDEIPSNNNQQILQQYPQYQQHLLPQQATLDSSKKQNYFSVQNNSLNFESQNPVIVDITSQEEKNEKGYIYQKRREQSPQSQSSNLISLEYGDYSSQEITQIQPSTQHQQQIKHYSTPQQYQSSQPIIQLDEKYQRNDIFNVEEQTQQQKILIRSSQLKQNQNNEEDTKKDEVQQVGIYEDFIINKVGKEKDKLSKCQENNNQSKYYQEHVILDISQEPPNIRLKERSEIQKGFQNSQNRIMNNVQNQQRKQVNDDDNDEIEKVKEIKKPIDHQQQQQQEEDEDEDLNNLQKIKGQHMKLLNMAGIDESITDKDYQSMQQEHQKALNDIKKEIIVIKQEANADQPTSIKDLSNQNLQYNNYQLQNELLKARLIIQDYKIREEKYETHLIKQQQIEAALKYQNTLMKQKQGKKDNPVTVDGQF